MMKISFFYLLRLKLNKRFDSDRSIVFEIGEGVGSEIVLLAEEGRGLAGPEGGGGGAEHVLVSSGAGVAREAWHDVSSVAACECAEEAWCECDGVDACEREGLCGGAAACSDGARCGVLECVQCGVHACTQQHAAVLVCRGLMVLG